MNEIKEKIEIPEEENDVGRRRAACRRGAREIKGNLAMVVVMCVLVAIVLLGIFFVIKTFMPQNSKYTGKPQGNSSLGEYSQSADTTDFESVIDRYTILMNDTALKEKDGNVVFAEGMLNYCKKDIDNDGNQELLMVTVGEDNAIEISVYEKNDADYVRNGYYVYTSDVFDIEDDAKTEIYVSKFGSDFYVCTEKYDFESGSWKLSVIKYDDGLKVVKQYSSSNGYDSIRNVIEKFGLKYCGSDYDEGSELKMNGDTDSATLLCSFDTKDNSLSIDIG